jgi:hypothetical protein
MLFRLCRFTTGDRCNFAPVLTLELRGLGFGTLGHLMTPLGARFWRDTWHAVDQELLRRETTPFQLIMFLSTPYNSQPGPSDPTLGVGPVSRCRSGPFRGKLTWLAADIDVRSMFGFLPVHLVFLYFPIF